jgi:hypothetical protein
VQTAANFLMKSRRFKLASEGIAAGKRRENKGKNPRKERAGRRPEESGYLLITSFFSRKINACASERLDFPNLYRHFPHPLT